MEKFDAEWNAIQLTDSIESRMHTELPESITHLLKNELERAYNKGRGDHIDEMWSSMQKSIGGVLTSLSK